MTRKEYRNHVHDILDLVMDIQELNVKTGGKVTVSVQTYREDNRVRVWLKGQRLVFYDFRPEMKLGDTEPEEIIAMLQKIKAELEK